MLHSRERRGLIGLMFVLALLLGYIYFDKPTPAPPINSDTVFDLDTVHYQVEKPAHRTDSVRSRKNRKGSSKPKSKTPQHETRDIADERLN